MKEVSIAMRTKEGVLTSMPFNFIMDVNDKIEFVQKDLLTGEIEKFLWLKIPFDKNIVFQYVSKDSSGVTIKQDKGVNKRTK